MRKILFWLVLIIVMVISQLPVEHLSSIHLNWWDKAQHVGSFFVLGILGFMAYPRHVVMIIGSLVCYGGLIELLQWLIGWRHGEFWDWIADIIGIQFAVMICFFYDRFLSSKA